MKYITTLFLFLLTTQIHIKAQNDDPIWDIGTKWTYEFKPNSQTTTYLINEIVDTITLMNRKLYVVNSEPETSGIRYFYYEDNKVYNYDVDNDILQLLYDFEKEDNYHTQYRPICDPNFPYDILVSKPYTIIVDSIIDIEMPDNTTRKLQYVTPQDTIFEGSDTSLFTDLKRSILDQIGFFQGGIHYTHDWEIGMYICDEFANFVGKLRCFENDSSFYNFVGYSCDSTWVISSVKPLTENHSISLYPNPTTGIINLDGINHDINYEVYSVTGNLLNKGISQNRTIFLKEKGLMLIKFNIGSLWISKRIVKLE